MQNRKATTDFIISQLEKIDMSSSKNKVNTTLYKEMFAKMSDLEFNKFMENLRDKVTTLSIIVPNGGDVKISVENNMKVAKDLGHNFFQKFEFSNMADTPDYTTPNEYLTMILPIRRAAQLLSKKISVPDGDKNVDMTSGQVTGKSKSSKLTLPEIQMLVGMGFKTSIRELIKIRGGDLGANNALNNMLFKTGKATQEDIEPYSTGVVSKKTLKNFLRASHITSTL